VEQDIGNRPEPVPVIGELRVQNLGAQNRGRFHFGVRAELGHLCDQSLSLQLPITDYRLPITDY